MAKKRAPLKKKKELKKKARAQKKVQTKKPVQIKKKTSIKKKIRPKGKRQVNFVGQITRIRQAEPATVIEWPRTITHIHTYGMLSPFFKGLREGRLMATRCPNEKCSEKRLWIPPRAHCPDCHTEMTWEALPNPVIGKIYTFTEVVYAGTGIELSTPYWQVDVDIPGLATIPKSFLLYGEPHIGMKVKAEFRTKNPTNTVLDYYWVPYEK
ncbi:MAG: hypothetical protein A2157_10335 [Deltaproteobacteria bacterium RBG_16_47_11]|nr:MAG: hypothetical protein A2157_10335 [Deltaproteobacteria bacterium RBG_16_47_11]